MNTATHPITPTLDGDRMRRYAEHLAFYGGDQWPASMRRQNRRLVFNYAKAIVDKTASYVLGGLNFGVDPVDDTPEAAARARETERILARVYDENQLDQLDFDNEVDASILGDGAYKVTWDAAGRRVRITAPDVQGLFAWWCGDDIARLWRVASRYTLDAEAAQSLHGITPKASRTRPGRSGSSASPPGIEIVEVWTDAAFELWADGAHIDLRDNPYGFIPFVIYPNLREPKKFWGVSDIPQIMQPQTELNRAMSQLSRILELSGNPIAVLENVDASEDIAVKPGAVWNVPEDAKAYLLDLLQGGGVKLHADYVDIIYRALHDLGEAPRTAFGDNRAGLSGVALNVELDPLLKKVQRKRLLREVAFKRRNEMVLRLLEQYTGVSYAPYRSRVVWGELLPVDRSRVVTDEARLVAAGIHSRRRAADELGVADPESEFAQRIEEAGRLGA